MFNFGSTSSSFNFSSAPAQPTTTPATFVQSTTKFSELPDSYRERITQIEAFIREQCTKRDEIAEHLKRITTQNKISIETLDQTVTTLTAAVEREVVGIQSFRDEVRQELKSAEIAARNYAKLSSTYASALQESVYLPSAYHWLKLEQFNQRMMQIKQSIDQVDEYLATAEHANASTTSPQALQSILQAHYRALTSLASKVAAAHTVCDQLREQFAALRGGSAAEIFKEQKKELSFEPFASMPAPTPAPNSSSAASSAAAPSVTAQPTFSLTGGSTTTSTAPSSGGFSFDFGSTPASSFSFDTSTFGSPGSKKKSSKKR